MKIVILGILFFISIAGSHYLMTYAGAAGKSVAVTNDWPSDSQLEKKDAYHLVMFLHPGCGCSKASLAELSRLMADQSELSAQIIFMKSAKLEKLFSENSLVNQAKLIPRSKIFYDQDGAEALRFGAETSGLTHLYKKSELLFAGGLTMARGHEGESVGKNAILSHLKHQEAEKKSLVFGCDIFGKLKTLTMVGTNVTK